MKKSGERNARVVSCRSHGGLGQAGTLILVNGIFPLFLLEGFNGVRNLVDSRKNWQILTVSRKYGKQELTVKEIFHYGMRFLFPRYCDNVRTLRQAPVSCDLDLGSISAALSGNYM